jgi:Tfp pilus assembly protein PilF
MRLDENALSGSAMTSLGVLYHKLPGWPISFGNDKKAEKLLKHALEINPDGIDPNYFYAGFLFDNGKYEQALKFAKKALDAPARADRPIADSGRKREIALLEAKIARKS